MSLCGTLINKQILDKKKNTIAETTVSFSTYHGVPVNSKVVKRW